MCLGFAKRVNAGEEEANKQLLDFSGQLLKDCTYTKKINQ